MKLRHLFEADEKWRKDERLANQGDPDAAARANHPRAIWRLIPEFKADVDKLVKELPWPEKSHFWRSDSAGRHDVDPTLVLNGLRSYKTLLQQFIEKYPPDRLHSFLISIHRLRYPNDSPWENSIREWAHGKEKSSIINVINTAIPEIERYLEGIIGSGEFLSLGPFHPLLGTIGELRSVTDRLDSSEDDFSK
jgi:hypothetical protein